MDDKVDRCPLDEVGRLVNHRLCPRVFLKTADLPSVLAAAADGNWWLTPIEPTRALQDKFLP